MPVTDLTGSDWNSPYRLPQGWTPYPDGSVGPSSGLPDWLKQLIPSPGAATPNAPGGPGGGVGPGGAYMPGGGVMGRLAVTPGAPSMGFPAQGGPQVFPPQNSTIPPNKSVGPFTGGTSTENAAGGSAWDPRNWFKADPNATFQQGQPMGDDVTGAGGGFNPLSLLSSGSPYWKAAIAAGGVLSPTPADTGELSPSQSLPPRTAGGFTTNMGPTTTPYNAPPATYPHMPWPDTGTSPAATAANAPPGNPSDTPRPGGPGGPPLPPRRPKNLGMGQSPTAPVPPTSTGNPRFGLYQPQVPGSGQGGPLSRSPIYTTLNLFGGR